MIFSTAPQMDDIRSLALAYFYVQHYGQHTTQTHTAAHNRMHHRQQRRRGSIKNNNVMQALPSAKSAQATGMKRTLHISDRTTECGYEPAAFHIHNRVRSPSGQFRKRFMHATRGCPCERVRMCVIM